MALDYQGSSAGKEGASSTAEYFGNKKARELAKKINDLTQPFQNDEAKFREILVNVGAEIFGNFEDQFTRVTASGGWKRAMSKLAEDAIDRVINYIDGELKHSNESTEIMRINDFYTLVTLGTMLGKSKESKVSKITTPLKKIGVSSMPKPGHTLEDENSGEEYKTSDVYENTGSLIA